MGIVGPRRARGFLSLDEDGAPAALVAAPLLVVIAVTEVGLVASGDHASVK